MKIITDFEKAKKKLSRENVVLEFYLGRGGTGEGSAEDEVRKIIEDVRKRKVVALREQTKKYDDLNLNLREVDQVKIARAYSEVKPELVEAMKLAAERIHAFHKAQKDSIWHEVSEKGLAQLIRPLNRVGFYVPGGTAAYPSTVLMTVIPARVAGVKEVVMVTPPRRNGIPPATLVAADIARVDRIFRIGGAQAIAALAYGIKPIPRVDKICGPGNQFVMWAKKLVFGVVDIDALQGPSDVLIIADDNSDPEYCAADLLAQAEHDPLAEAHLVTTSKRLAHEVYREVEQQLREIPRQSIAGESLEKGVIAVVSSLDEAIELANSYAPEHLCLMLDDAAGIIDKITNAGCIFTGREATVTLGDYVAGPSHALPTGGTARFSSPLNICDFIKFINVIDTDELDIQQLGRATSILARAEGLEAHARAIEKRLKDKG
jgi:histidinol dehydrogenase